MSIPTASLVVMSILLFRVPLKFFLFLLEFAEKYQGDFFLSGFIIKNILFYFKAELGFYKQAERQ